MSVSASCWNCPLHNSGASQPMAEEKPSPAVHLAPGKAWITWSMAVLFGVGLAVWWFGPPLVRHARAWVADHYSASAGQALEKQEWSAAYQALEKARAWDSQRPMLLRGTVNFLNVTGGEPATILHYLTLLEKAGQITDQDLVLKGQLHVKLADAAAALAVFHQLPADAANRRPALELLANIQRLQGDSQLAEKTLRRALSLDVNDSMCRLRLALMDQSAAFPEMREQARRSLWQIAEGQDQAALLAIEQLARDAQLTPPEAGVLMRLINAHPQKSEETRFVVLSGLLRCRPELRRETVQTEVARMKKLDSEQLRPGLAWLLREKEAQSVVELRPRDFFIKSAGLVEVYLQALGALGRWEDVEQMLTRPAGMPVSSAFVSYWRAMAVRKLDDDIVRVRQHLASVYEGSGRGRDGPLAASAAALAEEAGVWDVAAQLYEGLAENQPKAALPMLEKVRDMALRNHDTDKVLSVTARLLALRPENHVYGIDDLYMHLLAGVDLEKCLIRLEKLAASKRKTDDDHLCRALAAFRFGRLTEARAHLETIRDPVVLSVGRRAVHAGLLSACGQVGRAFQIAEQVPTALLLKEEHRFLARAL